MDVSYGLLLKKSWQDLKQNPIAFLPILVYLLFIIGLTVLVILEFGIFWSLGYKTFASFLQSSLGIKFLGILSFLIDFVILAIMGFAVQGMNLGLFNAITTKKKATKSDMWLGMRKFTFLLLRYSIILLLVLFVPVAMLIGLTALIFAASKIAGIIVGVLLGIISVIYFIGLILISIFGLLFFTPIASTGKSNSAIALIKETLRYSKNNLCHVFFTWLITFAISVVLSIPYYLSKLFPNVIQWVVGIVYYLVSLVIGVWLGLFLFNAYFNSKSKKL